MPKYNPNYNPNSIEAKIGEIGERIVDEHVKNNWNYHPYKPVFAGGHPIDREAISFTRSSFYYEVKTKPFYKKFTMNATGFDVDKLRVYESIDSPNKPVAIFFVDEELGMIYGNWLSKLKIPFTRGNYKFPKIIKGRTGEVVLFPEEHMKDFWVLTKEQLQEIKDVRNTK